MAFIKSYLDLNGRAPAEAEMRDFFEISAPSVHSMVKRLEERGLISRVRGQARSIALLVEEDELPGLER